MGESDPSLVKGMLPRKPGGENWGGLSWRGPWGNWRPSSRALISGNWGSEARSWGGGRPGARVLAPADARKGGKEPGKGKGGLPPAPAVSRANRAALAARFSLRGRGLAGRIPSILCSIILSSPVWIHKNILVNSGRKIFWQCENHLSVTTAGCTSGSLSGLIFAILCSLSLSPGHDYLRVLSTRASEAPRGDLSLQKLLPSCQNFNSPHFLFPTALDCLLNVKFSLIKSSVT